MEDPIRAIMEREFPELVPETSTINPGEITHSEPLPGLTTLEEVLNELDMSEETPIEVIETTYEEIIESLEIPPEPPLVIEEPIAISKETDLEDVPDNMARFKGASWFQIVQQQEIILAGVGGIGSYVSLFLSRVNPRVLNIFDGDSFEAHNMSGQLVGKSHIDINKAEVANKIAEEFSNYNNINVVPTMYTSESYTSNIMICGFDSIGARKIFFENWCKHLKTANLKECLFIDGRLRAEEYQIICIQGDDTQGIEEYRNIHLFKDNEAGEIMCTLKQTSHMAGKIAATMVEFFINFCNNLNPNSIERRIPYYHEYNGPLNITHNEY